MKIAFVLGNSTGPYFAISMKHRGLRNEANIFEHNKENATISNNAVCECFANGVKK